jgi:hypothetical protein
MNFELLRVVAANEVGHNLEITYRCCFFLRGHDLHVLMVKHAPGVPHQRGGVYQPLEVVFTDL